MKIALILLAILLLAAGAVALLASLLMVLHLLRRKQAIAVPVTVQPHAPAPGSRTVVVPIMPDPGATVAVPLPRRTFGTIVWLSGPLEGRRMPVIESGTFIGRDASADLVCAAPSISKRHLWIGVRDGRAVISDPGSTNGTFLATAPSERLRERDLESGDVIIFADDVARFRYEGG